MLKRIIVFTFLSGFLILPRPVSVIAQTAIKETITKEMLLYHPIHLNAADQTILPWYSTDLGKSFDFVLNACWNFWDTIRTDKNGLPYYMNHQVWRGDYNDRRGIGGDQFAAALASWGMYYGYSGNESVKDEMKFIADYYLTHSLSPENAEWPNIPYPYNTLIYSGIYDGDMVIGKGFIQPDKAGTFGLEMVKLSKMDNRGITDNLYLDAAVKIANTLARHVKDGDGDNSPLPFKVNAITGVVGNLGGNDGMLANYTTDWTRTMELFLSLIEMKIGEVDKYQIAFDKLLAWMKAYPMKTNKWGPYYEDISGWSDTQINACYCAQFMCRHTEYFPDLKNEIQGIFSWIYEKFGNKEWEKYGVIVVNEQTVYQVPGSSHSSQQASAELAYAAVTGDQSVVTNAVRTLSWATYMVDNDGKNCYPRDGIWMTDGYGDYVQHYLRSMAYWPELAPSDQNHLLSSTSVIQLMEYAPDINKLLKYDLFGLVNRGEVTPEDAKNALMHYRTYDKKAVEVIRMTKKPAAVLVNNKKIAETDKTDQEGWNWKQLGEGGIITIRHSNGNKITVMGN